MSLESLKRTVERWKLKLRGVDPDELEGEMREMDRAREYREQERRVAERRAARIADEVSVDALRRGTPGPRR